MTSEQSLDDLPFRDIQAICKERKLVATGKKADLVKRILDSQKVANDNSLSHVSTEPDSVTNEKVIAHNEHKTQQNVEFDQTKELDEAVRRRMRHERFGATSTAINMSTSGQSVSELQKLSLRAARFGISTSDRAF
jgi:hypothetical protein